MDSIECLLCIMLLAALYLQWKYLYKPLFSFRRESKQIAESTKLHVKAQHAELSKSQTNIYFSSVKRQICKPIQS
ncbi:hypothetical protein BCT46_14215 [Vibrio sp. 10N.261.46.E8]|nr:hypothetical protein BH584_04145 [Vibrio sp. 10N.261.45.E1]PMJ22149.1 hypothetical protein BCU27_17185 [Vibrio sp. 10N.286.45.B6]PML97407.1 hypothetical protein BCT66_21015 [Vibrio sp. 10N.261.49.E11]PMM76539.1 hypothetical protein BCT48_01870 [Vibrio sp. 10N.261.46.F12]PMM82502.1 hypothetical protein BCT46_14215 [Vibrio sp. 10N.261.46.E8]PMN77366.1 hypothetical protein BCT22_21615 [Vibrio sp. 10N.261.45.A1]PMN88657.1 hypothetical protein BCT25_25120 [Vibrio sp. 10N.261.45.A6]